VNVRWSTALVLALAIALTGVSGGRLEGMAARRVGDERLLYLPNGAYLKLASLGQAAVLADLIYLWAIQYYSNYERQDRFQYVDHVFGNVITELDPQYVDAYWIGALILTIEAHDLEAGVALLDRGLENNPQNWVLRVVAGWECHAAGQFERAAGYFCEAAAQPTAPAAAGRLCAGMHRLAGDERQALAIWLSIFEDPASDATTLAIAERQLRDLRVLIDIKQLTTTIEGFRNRNARYPESLDELQRRGYIDEVPLDPDGNPYAYDARTGEVSSAAGRLLGGR
jgi:tetratricopeptide (TPR) repeat protein